jgi:3-dehydroquinate synthase
MKSEIGIRSSQNNYRVLLSSQFDNFVIDDNSFFFIDKNLTAVNQSLDFHYFSVDANEDAKSLNTCLDMLAFLSQNGAKKDSLLIAVGGGVVQDLVTLVSSLYMRGIRWTYFPTTLMSMIDSCIGGKSSINVGTFKNIVGNIYPPNEIHIDLNFIKTLSKVDLASGLFEGIKICYVKGEDDFSNFLLAYEKEHDIKDLDFYNLIKISLMSKKWFIEVDEFDSAERKMLNFGHTFAHAIETASDFNVPHGISVGIGMLAALCHPDSAKNLNEVKLESFVLNIFHGIREQLSSELQNIDFNKFLEAFRQDKKHSSSKFKLVLPGDNGVGIHEFEKNSNVEGTVEQCLRIAIRKIYEYQ